MASPIVTATLQAALLSVISNILAQIISASQANRAFSLDIAALVPYVVWTLIATPPNVLWQEFLEEKFPSNEVDEKGHKVMSKKNLIIKFALDQTLGASVNNVAFIAGLSTLRGKNKHEITGAIQQDFWPIMSSGWKVWPFVSLLSFSVIPANRRILFGSTIGLFWGIYLSMLTAN